MNKSNLEHIEQGAQRRLALGERPISDRDTAVLPRAFGPYELLSELARGGMGVVFRARQVQLNRVVELKMILSGQLAGDEQIRRFYGEVVSITDTSQWMSPDQFSISKADGLLVCCFDSWYLFFYDLGREQPVFSIVMLDDEKQIKIFYFINGTNNLIVRHNIGRLYAVSPMTKVSAGSIRAASRRFMYILCDASDGWVRRCFSIMAGRRWTVRNDCAAKIGSTISAIPKSRRFIWNATSITA